MTDLGPGCTVTLGDQQWTSQVLALDVLLAAAPLAGSASVRLPALSPVAAEPGDPAIIELDNGEAAATVFTGTVTAVRRELAGTTVSAVDAAGMLARYRPSTTYEKVNAATVIRNLAGDVGVNIGDLDDGVALTWYAADPLRTALDHVARLAAWSGALARVDADGRLVATSVGATQAEVALRYGREVLALERTHRAREIEGFTVAGESGAGSADVPEALRPASDFFGGNRPDGPDAGHRWSFEPALRTTEAAGTASAAAMWRYTAGRQLGTLTAFLQPGLRPGGVIEIQDLPDPLSTAPVWLDRVRHRLGPDGAWTTARMYAGGPAAGGGLLGSLAGTAAAVLGL
jgi:hypothetical protein